MPILRKYGYRATVFPGAFILFFLGSSVSEHYLKALHGISNLHSVMAARASDKNPPQQRPKKPLGWLKKAGKTVLEQLKHTGVGLVCSVAYFDP
jgi:hypothetical protein